MPGFLQNSRQAAGSKFKNYSARVETNLEVVSVPLPASANRFAFSFVCASSERDGASLNSAAAASHSLETPSQHYPKTRFASEHVHHIWPPYQYMRPLNGVACGLRFCYLISVKALMRVTSGACSWQGSAPKGRCCKTQHLVQHCRGIPLGLWPGTASPVAKR